MIRSPLNFLLSNRTKLQPTCARRFGRPARLVRRRLPVQIEAPPFHKQTAQPQTWDERVAPTEAPSTGVAPNESGNK